MPTGIVTETSPAPECNLSKEDVERFLDELKNYMDLFTPAFQRVEQVERSQTYLRGLLGRVFALDFGIFTLALSASVWFTGAAMDRFALDPHAVAVAFAVGSLAPLVVWVVTTRTARMGDADKALLSQ